MPNRTKSEISGQRFGRLIAIKDSGKRTNDRGVIWICKCDCGKIIETSANCLKRGHSKSCGCLSLDLLSERAKHGHTRVGNVSREYRSWMAMKSRCLNSNCKEFYRYGGRGIKISDKWLGDKGFENFLSDMGPRPKNTTLDRWPNNDGNYEPGNCRWGTEEQQKRNTRRNVWLEYNGIKMVKKDWAKKWNIKSGSIQGQLDAGKSFEEIYKRYEIYIKKGLTKIGKANKRILCLTNGKEYNSTKEAGEELGICIKNISAVLHGRKKRAGGHEFKFI